MWFIGVEVEQGTSAPPNKKKNHLHIDRFTLSFTLKQSLGASQKWGIGQFEGF